MLQSGSLASKQTPVMSQPLGAYFCAIWALLWFIWNKRCLPVVGCSVTFPRFCFFLLNWRDNGNFSDYRSSQTNGWNAMLASERNTIKVCLFFVIPNVTFGILAGQLKVLAISHLHWFLLLDWKGFRFHSWPFFSARGEHFILSAVKRPLQLSRKGWHFSWKSNRTTGITTDYSSLQFLFFRIF